MALFPNCASHHYDSPEKVPGKLIYIVDSSRLFYKFCNIIKTFNSLKHMEHKVFYIITICMFNILKIKNLVPLRASTCTLEMHKGKQVKKGE